MATNEDIDNVDFDEAEMGDELQAELEKTGEGRFRGSLPLGCRTSRDSHA